jgi:cyclophilin family peptidyl-prolyl cis-trans isomerase
VKLVKQGFYDSLLFHRVIPTFMVQGGDPQSKRAEPGAMLGNGDVGYRIPAEFNRALIHKRGALAAARDENPERASSGCQFYIVQGRTFKGNELVNIRNSVNLGMKQKLLQDVMGSDSVMAKVEDFKLRGDKDGLHSYMLALQPKIDEIFSQMEMVQTPYQLSTYTTVGGTPHLDMNYTVFGEMVQGLNVLDSLAAQKTDQNNRPLTDLRMKIRMLK